VPEIKGVVTALIPTRQLFEEIDDVRIGTSARVVVFDQQGESVNAHTLPGGHQALREGGDRLEHIATPLLNLETGWGTYRHPDFGECFVAFAPVPATRWSLAVAGRSEALMPGLDRMTLLLLGGLVLAALGASLVIAFNVRNTLEPIRELTDLLEDVEQGAFDVELEADASGEIGQLGRAFNHMTSELQRHREELETRVQERTEEIQRINAELRDEIEERREAERALRESEQRYSALIEQSIEGIYLVEGGSLEIIDFNPAFLELTGYDAEEAHRMHVSEVIVNDDDYYEQMYQHIVSEGGMEPKEGKWRTSSGDTIDVSVTASYFETDDREIVFVVGRDIREKKRLREQLEVTDRLASLGTLAAGLAHEINNPLSYIVTNLYFLQEEFERHGDVLPGERADEWLDVVGQSLDGADRVQQIVDDLRSFYRSDDNEIGLVDVREVFESVVGLAESDLPPDAEIVRQFEEVPPVRANDSALGQVFMNILVNAIQALPQDRRGRSDRILVRTYMEDEKHVGIEISDTGEGISEEDRKHIFDPFFTTKSVDEGTGLGLSMSLNIVTSFDGEIDVESTVGEGTSFHVILPIASASDLSASSIPFEDSTSTGDRRST
jgi:PAS domain S-box-containing protein